MKFLLFVLTFALIALPVAATTTIEWWQFWTDPGIKPTIKAIVYDFEQQNPDIKVKLTDLTWANGHEKIVLGFASGRGPDVVELGSDWIAQFAAYDHLLDLTEDIKDQKKSYQGWGLARYKERIYAKPWFLGTRVLYYNRDLLTKAGYETDFIPINWDNLWEAAFKITELDKDIYGWGSNAAEKHRLYKKFLPFFWSAKAKIFSDDNKYCLLASEKSIAALVFYKLLHDSCGYVANQRGIEDAFLDGQVGFILSGDWLLKRIENENRTINFETTMMPGTEYLGRSFLGGEYLAINAASKNKEAAKRFVDFMLAPENQVRFCKANRSANPSSLEAQKDTYFTSDPNLQTFIKQIFSANHPPVDPDWVFIESAIEEAIEDALFGSRQPATALLEARKKIERLRNK